MIRTTASEARKNWFRLLDEVVAGGEVAIERNGRWVVLRLLADEGQVRERGPDYGDLLWGDGDRADEWGWTWGPEGLEPKDLKDQDG